MAVRSSLPELNIFAATTSRVELVWLRCSATLIALRIAGWKCPVRLKRLA